MAEDEKQVDAPAADEAAVAAEPEAVAVDAEFPTSWHRGVFVENLQREVLGARARLEELETLGDAVPKVTVDGLRSSLKNAEGEIERLAGKPAAKRGAKKA